MLPTSSATWLMPTSRGIERAYRAESGWRTVRVTRTRNRQGGVDGHDEQGWEPLVRAAGRAGREERRDDRRRLPRRREGEAREVPGGLEVLKGHGRRPLRRHPRRLRDRRRHA